MNDTPTTKPVRHVRRANVQAAIWRNANGTGVYYSVTFERRYRDDANTWHATQSFGRDDVLVLAKVADLAHDAIHELQEAEREQHGPGNGNGSDGTPPVANAVAAPAAAKRSTSRTGR